MRRRLLLTGFIVWFATPVLSPQTPPCPTWPATFTVPAGATVTLETCHTGLDGSGQPADLSWAFYVNGARTIVPVVADVTTPPSPTVGRTYWVKGGWTAPATPGVYILEVAAMAGGVESAKSPPLAVTVLGPQTVPATPSKTTIQ